MAEGAAAADTDADDDAPTDPKAAFKQKLFKYGVIAVLLLAALVWKGVKYFLDRTATVAIERAVFDRNKAPATPDAAATSPKAAATPAEVPAALGGTGPIGKTKDIVAQVQANRGEPTAEAASSAAGATPIEGNASTTTATTPNPGATAPVTDPTPAVTAPSAPPPASAAFRSWVQNLKISGVRAGTSPRVFIERTAYGPGDLVNPQLGISFEAYNAETRMLVFKDKSGAVVERRN